MIKYVCDWCQQEYPLNEITTVKLSNVYNEPAILHICRTDARIHMPERVQPMLSWTAP